MRAPQIFAAVGNIASVCAIRNGNKYVNLSYEEFVKCDGPQGGCTGGMTDSPYRFVLKHGGKVLSAADKITNCSDIDKMPAGARITSVVRIPRSEKAVMEAVATSGPVFVAVDASSWSMYTGGVFSGCSADQIDDAALVVGYDTLAQPPYWIIQNSWGVAFGMNGYILVEMFKNQCGITFAPNTVRCALN